jgi:hypothetical protein
VLNPDYLLPYFVTQVTSSCPIRISAPAPKLQSLAPIRRQCATLPHSIFFFAEEPPAFENAELIYILPEAAIHPFAGGGLAIRHCWRLIRSHFDARTAR